jgi:hypothetical protein
MLQKSGKRVPAETLNKPWTCLREAASAKAGRDPLDVKHYGPLPLPDFPSCEVAEVLIEAY